MYPRRPQGRTAAVTPAMPRLRPRRPIKAASRSPALIADGSRLSSPLPNVRLRARFLTPNCRDRVGATPERPGRKLDSESAHVLSWSLCQRAITLARRPRYGAGAEWPVAAGLIARSCVRRDISHQRSLGERYRPILELVDEVQQFFAWSGR